MITRTLTTYKNAYTGLSRSTWLLSLVMLINRSGTMVVPFMSLYLTSPAMGYSIGQAGFVFGMFGAGAFVGAWLGGKLTDRIGFYPVQLITLIGGGLLFIVLGQMKSYGLICIFTFALSFVNEAFRPANSTAIASYSKEENRTRSYSLNRLAINLGWAFGSGIGGIIAHYNYELLFWVDGITNIVAAILMWIFMARPNQKPVPHPEAHIKKKESVLNDKGYLWFTVLASLFACCFFQLFTNMSVYYKLERHYSEPYIGLLMAVNGLIIVFIEMVLIYKLEGKRKSNFYIVAGTILMGFSWLMLNLLPEHQAWAMVMIVSMTLAEILAMPFMNSYWISRSKPHNRGQYAAMYTMAWSSAQTLGPMAGAQIAEHYSFRVLWWIIGGLSLVTAFAFSRLDRVKVDQLKS